MTPVDSDGTYSLFFLDPANKEHWLGFVSEQFGFDDTWKQLERRSAPLARLLAYVRDRQGATAVLVEKRYVDRDYRSEFTAHYATTFERHDSFCTRLHFFRAPPFAEIGEIATVPTDQLESTYIGFCVVRPIRGLRLSRTVVRPPATAGNRLRIPCVVAENVNICGRELRVRGSYFIQQDGVVIRCAQATMWMVAAHMHAEYDMPRLLPADVTRSATRYFSQHGRPIPSAGLAASQMAQGFVASGYFPELYIRGEAIGQGPVSQEQMLAVASRYIGSGIPVIALVQRHAMLAIGCAERQTDSNPLLRAGDENTARGLTADALVLQDDAARVYRLLVSSDGTAGDLAAEYPDLLIPEATATLDDIWGIIVALPEKVYLGALSVDSMARQLMGDEVFLSRVNAAASEGNSSAQQVMSLFSPDGNRPLLRPTLMTCARFKRHLARRAAAGDLDMHPGLLKLYLRMPMPHHVWVVELTSASLWADGSRVLGEAVLDATSHPVHSMPYGRGFVAIHMPGSLWTYDATTSDDSGKIPDHQKLEGDDLDYPSCFALDA